MNISRRGFFQVAGVAIASVAIGIRLSYGTPEIANPMYRMDVIGGFRYGVNAHDLWDVKVWPKWDKNLSYELSIADINARSIDEHQRVMMWLNNDEQGPMPDTPFLELCAAVNMSQGWAQYKDCPMLINELDGTMQDATIPLSVIHAR